MESPILVPKDFSQHRRFYEDVHGSDYSARLVSLEELRSTSDSKLLAEKRRLLSRRGYTNFNERPFLEISDSQFNQVFRTTYRRAQDALEQLLLQRSSKEPRFGQLVNLREDSRNVDGIPEIDARIRAVLKEYSGVGQQGLFPVHDRMMLLGAIYEKELLEPHLVEPDFNGKLKEIFEAEVDLSWEIDDLLINRE